METSGNEITIDIKDNPQAQEYFSRKELMHECTVEIKFKLRHKDDEVVKGPMTSLAFQGYDPDKKNDEDNEDGMAVAKEDEPVMVVIKGKSKSSGY